MKKIKYLILVLLVFIFVTSCTMQKRIYRKGYYTYWKSSDSNKKVEEPLMASTSKNFLIKVKKPIKDSVKIFDCGDSLWLKTGMVANATIIEETETEVKYKLCDNLDGPISVVPKSNVERIKYAFKIVDCNDSLWLQSGQVIRIKILSEKDPFIKFKRCDDLKSATYKVHMNDVKEIKYSNGEVYTYKKTNASRGKPIEEGKREYKANKNGTYYYDELPTQADLEDIDKSFKTSANAGLLALGVWILVIFTVVQQLLLFPMSVFILIIPIVISFVAFVNSAKTVRKMKKQSPRYSKYNRAIGIHVLNSFLFGLACFGVLMLMMAAMFPNGIY